ncbi:MAG TPA: phytanoyl-CoA dioxygenase family protein, partial [Acidimicrobiales bacterium]|nr:phytanoyl-CoA dioxygenase family protein [Acidimicrobiales bacterium]
MTGEPSAASCSAWSSQSGQSVQSGQSGQSSYQRDGHVVVPGVLDGADVAACLEHLERLRAGRPTGSSIVAVVPGCDPFLDGMAADPRLYGLASGLMGGEVTCFGCTYMLKDGQDGPAALWHQDGYPWQDQLGIATAVTLWIALDDVDVHNGALQVIPGSHWLPAQPLRAVEGEAGGMFGAGMDEVMVASLFGVSGRPGEAAEGGTGEPAGLGGPAGPSALGSESVRVIRMAAGDVSAHHSRLVHGSGA